MVDFIFIVLFSFKQKYAKSIYSDQTPQFAASVLSNTPVTRTQPMRLTTTTDAAEINRQEQLATDQTDPR